MANDANLQILADAMQAMREQVKDLRAYLGDVRALLTAGAVSVQNWPGSLPVTGTFWPAVQTVSGTVSLGNLPNPLPVTEGVTPTYAPPVSLAMTGDFIPAQAGVAIKLVSGVFSAVTDVTAAIRSNGVDLVPLRFGANTTVILPYHPKGWCVGANGQSLRVAFTGLNTITATGQWVAA